MKDENKKKAVLIEELLDLRTKVEKLEAVQAERERVMRELSVVYDALGSAVSGNIITDTRGKITYVNPAFLRMFGYADPAELKGKSAADLFAAEKIKKFADVETGIDHTKGETEEFTAQRKDGKTFIVEVSSSVVTDHNGKTVGRMASFVDITRKKAIENELQKSYEKMKIFAYSVMHDLKSPSIAIFGLSNLLVKQYGDVLGDKGKLLCTKIMKAAEQAAELVEKINTYISSKEATLVFEPVNMGEIFQMITDEFSAQFTVRRIKWLVTGDVEAVKADRLSILRVFRNFVDNALKYGGESLTEIRAEYKSSDNFHVFSISDDGIGLKDIDSRKIFGTFQRDTGSRGIAGSGLGLAIVREIAERHNGSVWVEPGINGGITFSISISKDL